jgi:hypothetical protein
MKKHTMTYLNHFGYDISDFIPCEVCGKTAVDQMKKWALDV